LNDEQKDNLSVAKDAADNLLGLLNDILDLSRVESGKITLEQIEFHLPNVVKSVTKGLAVIALKKNLKLEAVIDKDVPELIKGDPVRLRQILINLINNAIKFTHKGTIYAKVKVSQIKDNQAVLQFSVVDQGIGIPPDKHEKVFEVFTQADDSTNRRFGGTGLGLAICKRLTEMMGGSIWVESEEGKGSTFHFTGLFDVIALKSTVKDDHPVVSSGPLTSMNHIKILLAEDNMVNQKIAIRMLEKQGWNVTAVENGQEVINRLDNEKFDVVLMDAQMPILDGLEATRLIRQNEKTTGKHIPIIALTARAMTEDREELVKAGMDGYVAKPIDRQKLFEEIEKILTKGINNE
jgi:CheY-like chemotaxis protein